MAHMVTVYKRQKMRPGVSTMRRTGRKWRQQVPGTDIHLFQVACAGQYRRPVTMGSNGSVTGGKGTPVATGVKRPRIEEGPRVSWASVRMARPASSSMHVATPLPCSLKSCRGRGKSWCPLEPLSRAQNNF